MPIKIVTDSTCDLPEEIVAQHGITVVPLYINFGSESYLDGVDLSREAFYARLPDCDPPPTTAMPDHRYFPGPTKGWPRRALQRFSPSTSQGASPRSLIRHAWLHARHRYRSRSLTRARLAWAPAFLYGPQQKRPLKDTLWKRSLP